MDPDTGTIMILLLGGDGFETVDAYGEGDTLISPTLPGFRLDVDGVFWHPAGMGAMHEWPDSQNRPRPTA